MGWGLGKTILANKIYNDSFIKKRFDSRAWVNVSQDFRTRELLLNILHLVTPSTKEFFKMDEEKLAKQLKKCMEDKYLIGLDDVWKTTV